MEYDKIEIRNHLIKKLVDAAQALEEVYRIIDTEHNRETPQPNIFTRLEVAIEEIDNARLELAINKD